MGTDARRAGRVAASAAVVMVVLLLAAVVLAVLPGRSAAAPVAVADTMTVVVGPGDTLWDLVLPHLPAGADPVAYVAAVADANGVRPSQLRPGDVLRLPQG